MPPDAADQHRDSLEDLCTDLASKRAIIVASNRGPVSFERRGEKLHSVNANFAGLGALQGNLPALAWVSNAVTGPERAVAEQLAGDSYSTGLPDGWTGRFLSPSRRAYHRYFNIICNPLLWFLHHRSWGFTHTPTVDREAHSAWEQGMLPVSEEIAAEVVSAMDESARPPVVMARGFQMHLVGGEVKRRRPDALLHYAIDVPWPSPSDWVMLPADWRFRLFTAISACDIVEMSSPADVRNLLSCFEEFLPGADVSVPGRSVMPGGESDPHTLKVTSHPPAVNFAAIEQVAGSGRTRKHRDEMSRPGVHTFVTAERIEPHRNIVRCVRAFGAMLDSEPELVGKVRFLLTLAPSSTHLAQYRRYGRDIESAVSDVNARHSRDGRPPLELNIENSFARAVAAMQLADTLVSVPIADSECPTPILTARLNLRNCTMLLSETAAVARLFNGAATLVSPADVQAMSEAMRDAVEMSGSERERGFRELGQASGGLDERLRLELTLRDILERA